MKLMKKWRRHGDVSGPGEQRDLARRPAHDDWGLSRFRQEMDRVFDRVWREFDPGAAPRSLSRPLGGFSDLTDWPAVDMAEDEKALTLRVDVPGLDAKDVDVEVSGNLLTIRGQRQDEWSDTKGGVRRRERRSGAFARTLTLPGYVDADKVEARYDKGTLTITIPRIPGKGPKRVQVSGQAQV